MDIWEHISVKFEYKLNFFVEKYIFKMSSANLRPICVDPNVLRNEKIGPGLNVLRTG